MKLNASDLQSKGFVQAQDGSWFKPAYHHFGVCVRNLGTGGSMTKTKTEQTEVPVRSPKRIRQSSKPLMNKLELAWFEVLKIDFPEAKIRPQAKRYMLANGAWYKPDFTAILNGVEHAWECKGPKQAKNVARGILTVKIAAHEWPEVVFNLVWKQNGAWNQQEVFP